VAAAVAERSQQRVDRSVDPGSHAWIALDSNADAQPADSTVMKSRIQPTWHWSASRV
jgi:hypothetical protein